MENSRDDRQHAFLVALTDERTVLAAGKKAGIPRSTVYSWMQDAAFRREVARVRDLIFTEALDRVNGAMDKAVAKLVESLDHGSSSIRLKAAVELCKMGLEIRQRADIETKIRDLEEQARRAGLLKE